MTCSPKCFLALLAFIFSIQASAQKSQIKQGNNGKLVYSYNKVVSTNNFELLITYKNETVIYKEQLDSVVLKNKIELAEFTTGLEKTIESLSDAKAKGGQNQKVVGLARRKRAAGKRIRVLPL